MFIWAQPNIWTTHIKVTWSRWLENIFMIFYFASWLKCHPRWISNHICIWFGLHIHIYFEYRKMCNIVLESQFECMMMCNREMKCKLECVMECTNWNVQWDAKYFSNYYHCHRHHYHHHRRHHHWHHQHHYLSIFINILAITNWWSMVFISFSPFLFQSSWPRSL